jgi:hypothetical protein
MGPAATRAGPFFCPPEREREREEDEEKEEEEEVAGGRARLAR